jgi:RHS repeat-associated protein
MRRLLLLPLLFIPPFTGQSTVDLSVSALNPAAIVTDSQTLAVSGTLAVSVTNNGTSPVATPFTIRAFEDRNNNAAFDAGTDIQLGTTNIASIAASTTTLVNITLSGTLQFSGNIIYAQADSANAIVESNEANNLRHTGQSSTFTPVSGPLNPVVFWQRTTFSQLPESNQILNTSAVGDLDGDNFPEIVFTTYGANESIDGVLRVLDGRNGAEKFSVTDPAYQLAPGSGITLADIDLDGRPEILTYDESCKVIAFEHDGTFKWRAANAVFTSVFGTCWSSVAVADLSKSGAPRIIAGKFIYDANGTLLSTGSASHLGGAAGANAAVADIDLDGNLDIVAGATAYRANGTLLWDRSATFSDSTVAIGNLDADPQAEIVLKPRIGFDLIVLEHDGSTKWTAPWAVLHAGMPTIGNFDSDPQAEIGVAGTDEYRVYEANGTLKWSKPIDDGSSGMTSASLFDFDNDGSVEVVFADQSFFYIWRGSDGTELFKTPRIHGTAIEVPVVADVDADGHADIIIPRTNYLGNFAQGMVVYRGSGNNWANTRRLWNQPVYSINHINDNLSVPVSFTPNWLVAGFNNFLVNAFLPGTGSANSATDLSVSFLRRTDAEFPAKTLLTARIGNGGSAVAPSALLRFTLGSGGPTLCQTSTSILLAPGQFQDVTCEWLAPTAGTQNIVATVDPLNTINEGNETNNTAAASLVIGLGPVSTVDDLTVRARDAAIDLKWTPVPGAVSYNIYRRTAAGTYSLFRGGYVNALGAFADTGLTNNTVYWYNVRWLNAQGAESPLGTEGSAMPIPRTQRGDTAPTITSSPATRARTLSPYSYLPVVADPDPVDTKAFAILSGPNGMSIHPSTGQILFTPTALQGGTHRVLWQVTDSRNRVTSQGFNLFVETQVINLAPTIISSAITSANVGRNYAYTVRATDPDAGDLVTYSLDTAPGGVNIHPTSGLITWLPALNQLGQQAVTVRARDILGFATTQSFQINVTNPNRQPTITSTPPSSVIVNNTLAYQATATDPDAGEVLAWSIVSAPTGTTINSNSGQLLFTPTVTGPINFTIRVSDLVGASTTQAFTVQVNAVANANPVFTSVAPTLADVNGLYSYQAMATDPDNNPLFFSLVSGPSGMTVSATGLVQFTPTATGSAPVTLRVQDSLGGFATQTYTITINAEDNTPPSITYSSPSINAIVSSDATITGSVTDANLVSWRLEYQVTGSPTWTLLNSGTTPVVNGTLGVLPVSRLANNPYTLRVTAFDRRQGFSLPLPVRVDAGQVRLGAFTLRNVDLRVPALQMPIEIRREYDSTKPYSNDFGQGWALGFSNFDLRVDAAFNVFLTMPNGRRVSFQFAPIQANPIFPALTNNYAPPPGYYDKLENLDCNDFLGGAQGFVCISGLTPFQQYAPKNWRLTTKDGTIYTIANSSVTRIEDRNGAWTNITPTGITTSTNRNVVFTRDSAGRITQLTDALGKRVQYSYDSLGRLVSVLDQENRTTSYAYFSTTHLITQVSAPSGCQAIRQEFDLTGKLTARIDAAGNRTEFTYDIPNRRTTTTYPGGITTIQAFDATGNLIAFTDGRGLVHTFTYDAAGRRLSTTFPSGRQLLRTYDGNGNPITEQDGPTGGPFHTTTYAYNALNLMSQLTRPNGDYQTYTYNAQGNLTTLQVWSAANTLVRESTFTYDANGKLLNSNDEDGVFNYTYDSSGNVQQRFDASLRTETVNYDALGNPIAYFNGLGQRHDSTYNGYGLPAAYRTNSLAFATIAYNDYLLPTSIADGLGFTYSYQYNCSPQLTRVTDPASGQTNYTRSPLGSITNSSDTMSRATLFTFNGNSAETLRTSPAGDSTATTYNNENMVASKTTGLGSMTYSYDGYARTQVETLPNATLTYTRDARGRIISVVTTGANAGTHTNTWNAANQLLSSTDRFGRTVTYSYDTRGRRSSLLAPDGSQTTYLYDAGGKVSRISTGSDYAEFTYDAAGRRSQLLYSNGVRATYAYDSRSRLTSLIWYTPSNTVIRSYLTTYDAAGRPTNVVLNDGSITRTFDSRGNLTSENIVSTLWGNRSGTWSYDAVGNRLDAGATFGTDHRQLTRGASTFTHDAAGNQNISGPWPLTHDIYNRNIGITYTSYTYDYLGRRNEATGFAARRFIYDNNNVVNIEAGGNLAHRFTHTLHTDELLFSKSGGPTLFYILDGQGSVIAITDPSGAVVHQRGYDAWGDPYYAPPFPGNGIGQINYSPFSFQGREYEPDVQLYHFRAREYSPILGRFIEKDPAKGRIFLPMTQHPYMFALNAPTTFVDPLGREADMYTALITENPLARANGFAVGFSVGFSGATLSFLGHFLDEYLRNPKIGVGSALETAAFMAEVQIAAVIKEFEAQVTGGDNATSVGTGLSEGAPVGLSAFTSYINSIIR